MDALNVLQESKQGCNYVGNDADCEDEDNDSEHYLSDKYPWNPETESRGQEDDFIDYYFCEKCRAVCYRQFWYQGKHDCSICQVISCKQCARRVGGRNCTSKGCNAWICGACARKKRTADCPSCQDEEDEEKSKDDEASEEDEDRKPPAKKTKSAA